MISVKKQQENSKTVAGGHEERMTQLKVILLRAQEIVRGRGGRRERWSSCPHDKITTGFCAVEIS